MRKSFMVAFVVLAMASFSGCGASTGTTDPGDVPAITPEEEQAAQEYEESMEIDPATGSPKGMN